MRRSIRTMLGIAATAGIVALGIPALATSASATTAGANTSTTEFRHFGPYFAKNFKAKVKGSVFVKWNYDHDRNRINVKGQLTDLDFRGFDEGGKCAYATFKVHHFGDPGYAWKNAATYRWCGADKAPRFFDFWKHNVDGVKVQVCQVGKFSHFPTRCGNFKPVYFAQV
jgi:hypothetical protein